MNKISEVFSRNILNIFIIFLVILNLLPILAPIFAHFGFNWLAKPIYWIYSYSCHQFHWRSIHIYDHQCAWCTRDMFLWGAMLAVTIAVKKGWIKGLKWYWMVPFTIPIALDGGIQTIATILGFGSNSSVYISTNFMRMFTGSIFGLGLGNVLSSLLLEEQQALATGSYKVVKLNPREQLKSIANIFAKLFLIFLGLFLTYIGLVQVWRLTSPNYQPSGIFDHVVRQSPPVEEWFENRGLHGTDK